MKVKHRIYLQIFFLSCTFCIYCPPPPPPPLPGQLANQTLAQLMQVFGTSSALNNNSTTSGLALSMLSTTNAPSVISSNPTITTNAKMPSSSATGTTANGTKPSSASSVAQVSSLLSNQNSSLTTRANLALNRYTTAKGTPVKITPSNKYQMSQGAIALNQSFMTNFTGSTALQMPPLTFPDKNVAQAYSDFATALQSVPGFIMMFKKLHITALHELYLYLTGIYATLNLLNIADLKTYMVLEKTLGLNKKTLIISYMVDLIASQLTSTLQGCMPGMPQQVAIQAGIAAISNQGGNNINMLVLDMEQTVLGLLGMDPLTPTQVATLVSSLTSSANAQLIASNNTINQTDYQAALKIVSSSNINFVQQLSESQAEALMEAINTISDGIANAQQIASVQNIVNQLQAPNQAPVLSANDTQFFQQIVSQIAYGKPFSQVYSTVQSLAQKINTISATPLTAVECSTLISVISYLSLLFEQQLSSLTVSAIGQLNIKNPTQAVLSVGQQIKLQITASSMLTGSSPVQLISLNQNDRILLSQAFQIFSQNCPAGLTASQSSFSAIAQLLAQSAVDQKSLSSSQASALQAVLSYLNQFTFSSTTLAQAENAFSAADQTVIGQAITQINSASFTSFNQLSASQQQLVLAAFQQLDAVVQTRSALHTQDAALLQGLLQEDNTAIVSALNSLSMADYQNLSYLYDYLKGLQSAQTSISTMNTVYKSQTPSPIATLQTIFTPAKTGSTGESFIDLINQLNQQNNANSVIQQVIASLTPDQLTMYQAIAASLQKATIMQMSSLTSAQQQLLLSFFQPYLTSLQSSSGSVNSSNPNNTLFQTIYTLIGQTHAFNTGKASYLWVLKKYLLFFNAYTASLQTYQSNVYQGFTAFAKTAQYASQALANNPLQTVNPPLFLYDANSMRSMQMIPQLAPLVEGTQVVPYPTFCVEQALHGSTVNPLDGNTYSNTVTLGQGGFTYNKFFFMDTTQQSSAAGSASSTSSPAELSGSQAQGISWLKKVSIPISNQIIIAADGSKITNYDHMYITQNMPQDVSGFYMNIPVFSTNPTSPSQVVIRLYEQEINAQPDWLSHSGFTSKTGAQVPGVITVLRGCLGDFLSLINLGIFDPCLTVIFKSAMLIDQPNQTFQNAKSADPQLAQDISNCAAYIQEQTADNQRMQATTTVSNQAVALLQQSTAGGNL